MSTPTKKRGKDKDGTEIRRAKRKRKTQTTVSEEDSEEREARTKKKRRTTEKHPEEKPTSTEPATVVTITKNSDNSGLRKSKRNNKDLNHKRKKTNGSHGTKYATYYEYIVRKLGKQITTNALDNNPSAKSPKARNLVIDTISAGNKTLLKLCPFCTSVAVESCCTTLNCPGPKVVGNVTKFTQTNQYPTMLNNFIKGKGKFFSVQCNTRYSNGRCGKMIHLEMEPTQSPFLIMKDQLHKSECKFKVKDNKTSETTQEGMMSEGDEGARDESRQDGIHKDGENPGHGFPSISDFNQLLDLTNDEDENPKKKKQKTGTVNQDAENEGSFPFYKNVDQEMITRIENEILSHNLNIHFSDIAGLENVKTVLTEMIIYPHKNPDLFTGLRAPPKGLLLFGPPGNGKTLIAKAVAAEAGLTFFFISASALTSKWVGDGEKMVKALFAVARKKQPSFIFIDEIDSILCTRGGQDEHEATRRLKTEFLLQFDGAGTAGVPDKIMVMGATNRPQDLDEAARRRFSKRIFVPLPVKVSRKILLQNLLSPSECGNLSEEDLDKVSDLTEGYSGHDLTDLCKDAAMGPVREAMKKPGGTVEDLKVQSLRPISITDFENSMKKMKPSVSTDACKQLADWDQKFGCSSL